MATGFAAGTYPLPWTIERFGRRNILIWSAAILTICMIVFVTMIGLPHPSATTQWVAVAAIVLYNFVFGYGWIGVPWLYGPEVCVQQLMPNKADITDRATQISPSWRSCRCFRRVVVFFYHGLRRRNRARECGLEDLDLDVVVMRRRRPIRVLHVSGGESLVCGK